MTKAKTSKEPPARTHKLDSANPKLTYIGESKFDAWNSSLANQALSSGWYGNNPNADRIHDQQSASLSFLAGVEPKGELEGMLAAQLLASHNAAMECYRRAMIAEQTFEGRKENLGQANKLSRTHAQLDVYYYGYGFDTGVEEVYYWYPAEDVIVTDVWVEYVI